MKDITIVILLTVIVILTGIIDATLSLNDEKAVDCLFEQAKRQSQKEWTLDDLYNDGDIFFNNLPWKGETIFAEEYERESR